MKNKIKKVGLKPIKKMVPANFQLVHGSITGGICIPIGPGPTFPGPDAPDPNLICFPRSV